jgi:hypothetical protein
MNTRPKITLPKTVEEAVARMYRDASVILEYGSGGSTVLASELPGKKIFSVESDKSWAANLESYLSSSETTVSIPLIYHVDIGPTQSWGHPINDRGWRNFHQYPMSIWADSRFIDPDVVLIDGRFRVGCFLTCLVWARKSCTILFDDYADRPYYQVVEKYIKPAYFAGRMAIFNIQSDQPINKSSISDLIRYCGDPS